MGTSLDVTEEIREVIPSLLAGESPSAQLALINRYQSTVGVINESLNLHLFALVSVFSSEVGLNLFLFYSKARPLSL